MSTKGPLRQLLEAAEKTAKWVEAIPTVHEELELAIQYAKRALHFSNELKSYEVMFEDIDEQPFFVEACNDTEAMAMARNEVLGMCMGCGYDKVTITVINLLRLGETIEIPFRHPVARR